MDGAGDTVQLLADYDAVLAGWSDPDADYEKLGVPARRELEDEDRGGERLGSPAHDRDRDGSASAARPRTSVVSSTCRVVNADGSHSVAS